MKAMEAEARFNEYAASFPRADMIQLKIDHTARVVENAREIMQKEADFPVELREVGALAAQWHDVGRFEQFTKWQTFDDEKSVNHALLSCSELLRLGWLDDLDAAMRNLILKAIAFHNLRDVPPNLSDAERYLVHLVRDADKLDIFTVLEHAFATQDLSKQPALYLGRPFVAPLSSQIVESVERGTSVAYGALKSFADFVLVQVAWCNGGLYFPASCAMTLSRGCVAKRCAYLCSILPKTEWETVKKCCAIAEDALKRKADHGA